MSDQEKVLLLRAQNGDAEAFAQIVEAYQRQVFNLCYRMLGDPYEAEDAAQEAFLRAFKALKRYDLERKFSTWLLTIASRYCIDQLRRRRLKTFSIENFIETGLSDPGLGPEASLRQSEEEEAMQDLLQVLKPMDRTAIVMRYWYEMSYEEIAAALSLSVSAVKSRLHRARKDLANGYRQTTQAVVAGQVTAERQKHGSPAF